MLRPVCALALLLALLDHATTYLCLRTREAAAGLVEEANPVAAWLFDHLGVGPGLLLDTAITALALLLLLRTPRLPRPLRLALAGSVAATSGVAAANNLIVAARLGVGLPGAPG